MLVNEVDEKKQARDRERARQEEQSRLADQLRHAESLDAVKRVQVRPKYGRVYFVVVAVSQALARGHFWSLVHFLCLTDFFAHNVP